MHTNELPKFSLVVSNYNNAKYLDEMVQSVILQTWLNWEMIFVDDASFDRSLSIMKRYSEEDHRIKIFENHSNRGAAACLNIALKLVTGKIIGRLDSDDKLSPFAIELMMSSHLNNKSASLICSHSYSWDPNSDKLELWQGYSDPGKKSLIFGCTVGHFATWKKNASDRIAPIDQTLKKAVDLDLYLKLEEVGTVSFIDQPVYYYRQHDGGISQGKSGIRAHQYAIQATIAAHLRRKGTRTANIGTKQYRSLMRAWYLGECHPLRWIERQKCNQLLLDGLVAVPSLIFTKGFWSVLVRNNFLQP